MFGSSAVCDGSTPPSLMATMHSLLRAPSQRPVPPAVPLRLPTTHSVDDSIERKGDVPDDTPSRHVDYRYGSGTVYVHDSTDMELMPTHHPIASTDQLAPPRPRRPPYRVSPSVSHKSSASVSSLPGTARPPALPQASNKSVNCAADSVSCLGRAE